MVPQWYWVYS